MSAPSKQELLSLGSGAQPSDAQLNLVQQHLEALEPHQHLGFGASGGIDHFITPSPFPLSHSWMEPPSGQDPMKRFHCSFCGALLADRKDKHFACNQCIQKRSKKRGKRRK